MTYCVGLRLDDGIVFASELGAFSTWSGLLIPCRWTRMRWMPRSAVKMPGKTATWNPKKRESVAPETSVPLRKKVMIGWPTPGTTPAMKRSPSCSKGL